MEMRLFCNQLSVDVISNQGNIHTAELSSQQTTVPSQEPELPTPMTVIGEQFKPRRTSTSWSTMPRRPNSREPAAELAYNAFQRLKISICDNEDLPVRSTHSTERGQWSKCSNREPRQEWQPQEGATQERRRQRHERTSSLVMCCEALVVERCCSTEEWVFSRSAL